MPGSCVASLVSQAVKSNPWRRHRQAAITAWRATVPINRRTARSNRDEPPSSTTAASPVTITRPDGTTVTEPPQPPGRSVCAFEKPEPPGGGGRLEWERRLTRSLASGSWWRGVAPTMLGSMPSMTAGVGACGQTAAESLAVSLRRRGSPKARSRTCSSALSKRGDRPPIQGRGSARDHPNRQIRSLVIDVHLVGSRRICPAQVGCAVDPAGSRRITSDRLDDQTDDQAPRPASRCSMSQMGQSTRF